MEIPSLPTDNLYKFMAFAGLVILVAGQVLFHTVLDKSNETVLSLKAQREKGEAAQRFKYTIDVEIPPDEYHKMSIDEKYTYMLKRAELIEKFNTINENIIDANADGLRVKALIQTVYFLRIAVIFATVLGMVLLVAGIGLWYYRVQRLQDVILWKEAVPFTRRRPPRLKV
jgi:hypothetical protein